MQWVKGIENLNVSRFRTQGIVGAAVTIRTSTASCREVDCHRIINTGFARPTTSSCQ